MIDTSSELPRNSSKILENHLEILENIWKRSWDPRVTFGESLEIFGQWLAIFVRPKQVERFFRRRTKQLPLVTNENVTRYRLKFFYNISFPEGRCKVITTDENEVPTCDNLMQIIGIY